MNWMLIRFVRTTLNRAMVAAWLAVALVPSAWGWSDHASLVWPLLRSQPELIHQTVAAEPLGAFLTAQQTGIAETLEAVESWSVATIKHYPPTPEELRWGTDHAPTTERFFAAIRVNSMLPYRLSVDSSPERAQPEQPPLAWSELSFFLEGVPRSLRASRRWPAAGLRAAGQRRLPRRGKAHEDCATTSRFGARECLTHSSSTRGWRPIPF